MKIGQCSAGKTRIIIVIAYLIRTKERKQNKQRAGSRKPTLSKTAAADIHYFRHGSKSCVQTTTKIYKPVSPKIRTYTQVCIPKIRGNTAACRSIRIADRYPNTPINVVQLCRQQSVIVCEPLQSSTIDFYIHPLTLLPVP